MYTGEIIQEICTVKDESMLVHLLELHWLNSLGHISDGGLNSSGVMQ